MAHTYVSNRLHCVFSTQGRKQLLRSESRNRLWPFIASVTKDRGMKALAVGGVEDHVHILLSLPPAMALAKAMQVIKAVSSKWISEELRVPGFAWQEGYSAFSVSVSHVPATIKYINTQEDHHRKKSFDDELRQFLKKNGIEYEEKYLLG